MSSFLHFPKYYGNVVNVNHIISLRTDSRVAVQDDIGKAGKSIKEGDIIFCIYIKMIDKEIWQLNFDNKEERQSFYNKILAAIKPITIEVNPTE